MSDLFKQALTVTGMITLAFLVCIGTMIITGSFNEVLLKQRKFWLKLCGDRPDGPPTVLALLSFVLIVNGYLFESPWLLGFGFAVVVLCYAKYRETLKKDPFEDRDE